MTYLTRRDAWLFIIHSAIVRPIGLRSFYLLVCVHCMYVPSKISYLDHQVQSKPQAVVPGFVGIAPDCVDIARELLKDDLPSTDNMCLAFVGWDRRSRAAAAWSAALETGRSRAETYSLTYRDETMFPGMDEKIRY